MLMVITSLFFSAAFAQTSSSSKTETKIRKVRQGARIKVTLVDNSKLEGYMGEAKSLTFILADYTGKNPTELSYAQVKKIDTPGERKVGKRTAIIATIGFIVLGGAAFAVLYDK